MFKQGPLRAFTSYAVGWQAYNLHNFFGVVVLCMVGAHVLGVAYESWRGRENLLRAMLTGQKNLRPPAEVVRPAHAHPLTAAAIVLGVGLAGGAGITALASLPGLGVPPATLDPMYSDQCGACHIAYSPSLAPASTWNAILADLQHHFGDDATLSAAQIAHIRAYLDANSAGHWDTYPAHLMRTPRRQRLAAADRHAGLAADAPQHPRGGLPLQGRLSKVRLRCVPQRCRDRPLRAAEHRHSGEGWVVTRTCR